MSPSRLVVGGFYVASLTLSAAMVTAQPYPARTIRVVTSEAGGGNDMFARLIAQGVSGPLGQTVIVDNRGSAVSGEVVAKAAPDGYTLLVVASSLWLGPLIRKISYDVFKELSPITHAGSSPNILVVHPSLPVRSVKDLIALAKARPGDLNDASNPPGSASYLSAELFKSMARVKIVAVPYKGAGLAVNAVIGGEVQMTFNTSGALTQHIKSGRLKALAVTGAQQFELFPDLPTVAAAGLEGYESVATYGVFAPAKTPTTIIVRLNQEIVRFVQTGSAKEKLLSFGVQAVGGSPEEFAAMIKSDVTKIGKLIQDTGIKAD